MTVLGVASRRCAVADLADWRIEECFQAAKNEAGLGSYQVRDHTAYLSATRATAEKGDPQPVPNSSAR